MPTMDAAVADDIAADLQATLAGLARQELITPEEAKSLEEEIERIRQSAEERVDASTWEAADTLRENVAASLSGKQDDAVDWATESLERYAPVAQGGASPDGSTEAAGAELMKALEKLGSTKTRSKRGSRSTAPACILAPFNWEAALFCRSHLEPSLLPGIRAA